MARYEKYKDSGIQWIGEVPEHWKNVPVSALFREFSDKGHPDFNVLSVYREYGVIEKDSRDDNHNVTSENTEGYKAVDIGDFVINKMKAWQGSMGVSDFKGIVSPAYITCRFRTTEHNRKFIHHLLRSQSYINHYNRLSDGVRVGQWDMHFEDFKRLRVFLPTRDEQDRIVSFIDSSLAEIDKAIAQQQRMIDLLNERKQIIIQNAVTKGLDPNAPMKDSGVRWIGLCPADWEVVSMKRVAQIVLGKMLQDVPKQHTDSLEAYFCAKDIHFSGIDTSDLKKMYFSPEEKTQLEIKKGDLLIVEGGAAGSAALMTEDISSVYIQNSVFRVRSRGKLSMSFLRYFMFHLVKAGYIDSVCNKATLPHYTKEKVGSTPVCVPSESEQSAIIEYLDEECGRINIEIKKRESIITSLRERKRIIINDVVTGKIKVS